MAQHAGRSLGTTPVSQTSKPRITWVDITKGVAMFLVFFGHLGTQWFPALAGTLAAIYTFHMPLFFVVVGAMLLSALVNLVVQRHARWAVGDFSGLRGSSK